MGIILVLMDTIGGLLKWNMSQSTLQKTSGFIGLRVDVCNGNHHIPAEKNWWFPLQTSTLKPIKTLVFCSVLWDIFHFNKPPIVSIKTNIIPIISSANSVMVSIGSVLVQCDGSVLILSLVELWWMSLFYYLWLILHVWIRRPWYSRDSFTRCESAGYHRFITPRNLVYFIWDGYGYAWSHSNSCETHKKPF